MNYPLVTEYIESIRFSTENLDKWKSLEPVLDSSGSVVMSNGGFAVVFKMRDRDSGRFYALKCFLRDQPGRSEDYAMIASELEYASSPFLLKFEYLDKELFVDAKGCDENEFPVLLMDWVDGEPLDVYVRCHFRDSYKMDMLAYQFSRLSMWLMSQTFAHGDLKPDNVMVRADGSLVLIDYDGMFVPQMEGSKAREIGTPHFRHPNRTDSEFNEHIDDFSIISILLSLKLIAADPELMDKYGEADRLLFSEADYRNMSGSKLVKEVFPAADTEINMLFGLLTIAIHHGNLSKTSFRLLDIKRPEKLMTQDFMPNGDLAITFKDGTKAILMYSEAVPASPFFATKVKETGFTAESKAGSVACWVVLLKNGKKAVLQFFGKAKEQANMLALSPEYSSDKLKSFLNSLNLAKLVRDNGTFIVVLCLPKDVEFPKVVIKPERDKSFEPCYF